MTFLSISFRVFHSRVEVSIFHSDVARARNAVQGTPVEVSHWRHCVESQAQGHHHPQLFLEAGGEKIGD